MIFLSMSQGPPALSFEGELEKGWEGVCQGVVDKVVEKEDSCEIHLKAAVFQRKEDMNLYSLGKILIYSDIIEVYPGNKIMAGGMLKNFQKPNNPGEFDSHYYYKSKGFSARFTSREITIVSPDKNYIKWGLFFLRSRLSAVYDRWLPKDKAGILKAMFLGDKEDLDEDIKELYARNNLGHILAISGLHISIIGLGAYKLILKLFRHKRAAALGGMAFGLIYGLMTGFGISASRAVVMMLLSFLAVLAGRTYDLISALCLGGSLILLLHPLEIRNAGFLLSFGAVGGIGLVNPVLSGLFDWDKWEERISKKAAGCMKGLLASISVQLATIPIVLYFFYEYPLYGIVINLFVIPLLSLLAGLSIGAGLIGCIFLPAAGILAGGIYYILEFYEILCRGFSKLPYSLLTVGKPQISFLLFYYGILAAVLVLCRFVKKPFVLSGLVFLLFLPVRADNPGLIVSFLDVGQGDGIYMETKEGLHMLVDGGSSDRGKLGRYTLEPFLKSMGVNTLDYVFLSHLDSDHTSGIMELIEDNRGIYIGRLVLPKGVVKDEAYEELTALCQKKGIAVSYIKEGGILSLGPLSIRCISPLDNNGGEDRNENSMVLEVCYGNFSMLLTGDLGEGENSLWDRMGQERYTVLKAGHHGSKFSTSAEFLDRVNPDISVISCGEGNRYGHPHKEVLDRLAKAGCPFVLTQEAGAVAITTDGVDFDLDYFHETR